MLSRLVATSLRVLTWCCVVLIVFLSLLPGRELRDLSLLPVLEMVRAYLPAPLEHLLAYAGSAAIATAAYGPSKGVTRIVAGF